MPLLLVPAALFGVAQGINLPNVCSLLNAHAPNENRGAFMATNGMSLRTGQTIGLLLMAFLTGTLGLTGAYLASAGIALAAFVLVLAFVRQGDDDTARKRQAPNVRARRAPRVTARYLANERLNQGSMFVTGSCPFLLPGNARVPWMQT